MPSSPPLPSCPFCRIASSYPPHPPEGTSSTTASINNDQKHHHTQLPNTSGLLPAETLTGTHAHLVLSTRSVMAFLDIMPLTKGHVLLVTRDHYEKLGDLDVAVAKEVCFFFSLSSPVCLLYCIVNIR